MSQKNIALIVFVFFTIVFLNAGNAESLTVAGIEFADNAFVDTILSTDFTGTCGKNYGTCSTLEEALVGADVSTYMDYGEHDLLPGDDGDYNSASPPTQYVQVGFTDNVVVNGPGDDIAIFENDVANSVLVALDLDSIHNPYSLESISVVVDTTKVTTLVNVGYLDLSDLGVASGESIHSLFISSALGENGEVYWNDPDHPDWGVPEVTAIGALHTEDVVEETVYVLNLTATVISESCIDLEWSITPDNPDVADYNIYRDDTLSATVADTAYSDENLSPSTAYSYVVEAVDSVGNPLVESLPVGATTLDEQDTPDPLPDDEVPEDPAVPEEPSENHAPVVDAGGDIVAEVSENVALDGIVEDDGLPVGMAVTVQWRCVSGDAEAVELDAPTSVNSTVTFTKSGTYVLALDASDGDLEATDTIEVEVVAPGKSGGGAGNGSCFINSLSLL